MIPSLYYPMPVCGNFRVYMPDNTELLQDNKELLAIASKLKVLPSEPYKGTSMLYGQLRTCGYAEKHKVELYGGWVISLLLGEIRHRLWLVIDGKSVIDIGFWELEERMLSEVMEGNPVQIDDTLESTRWTFEEVCYGVNPRCIYVGCRQRNRQ